MSMCPLCNGMISLQSSCSICKCLMDDRGRLMDYFDDYSAYLDIDGMKLYDGISNDAKNRMCPHVLYCSKCDLEKTILIKEQKRS